jgi:predicted transcriptional regulator with HTH domain
MNSKKDFLDDELTEQDAEEGILECIELGHMEVVGFKNGEPLYRLTGEGRKYVEWLLKRNLN